MTWTCESCDELFDSDHCDNAYGLCPACEDEYLTEQESGEDHHYPDHMGGDA